MKLIYSYKGEAKKFVGRNSATRIPIMLQN